MSQTIKNLVIGGVDVHLREHNQKGFHVKESLNLHFNNGHIEQHNPLNTMTTLTASGTNTQASAVNQSTCVVQLGGSGPRTNWNLPIVETDWGTEVGSNGVDGFPASKTAALIGIYFFGDNDKSLNYIVPFKLPYIAPGHVITSATLAFNYVGKSGSPVSSVDVYGLSRTSTALEPKPIFADYYVGPNDVSNTLLLRNLITPTTHTGPLTISGDNVVAWLQAMYVAVGAGGTVYVRLNAQNFEDPHASFLGYNISIPSDVNPRSTIPTLSITTSGALANLASRITFSFTLPAPALTSAGVFDPATGALIRTLWANIPYTVGTAYSVWDGKDDMGVAQPSGNYKIKVIYHNVVPVWEGVIGNTSAAFSGPNVFRSFNPPVSLASDTVGGNFYFCSGYNEIGPCFGSVSVLSPQTCNWLPKASVGGSPHASIDHVTTDGTLIYWSKGAGGVAPKSNTYVFATNMAGTSYYTFPSGTSVTGQMVSSVIDNDTTAGQPNFATGLAVMPNWPWLFVAHGSLGIVRIFNKTSGAIRPFTLAVTNPGSMCCDTSGHLYVVSGTTVLQYFVNVVTGGLTLTHTWTGFTAPMAVGCDNGTTLAVVDGGTSQQIKLYNTSTFALITAFGTAGGNDVNGPTINNNNTFMFGVRTNATNDNHTGIAFAADGSFVVIDNGNFRMLHYSVAGSVVTFVEQIAYLTVSYNVQVDPNNVTRVFNQFLEYAVDYTKTLDNGSNGSWVLVKNWIAGLSAANYNISGGGIRCPVTLSNGRTYAIIFSAGDSLDHLVELTSTGVRDCGHTFTVNSPKYILQADGSLHTTHSGSTIGVPYVPTTAALTGFDGSNNPIWAAPSSLINWTPQLGDPIPFQQNKYATTNVLATSNGVIPILDNGVTNANFHLAGILLGTGTRLWRAGRTPVNGAAYGGSFPRDGGFDIGHGVNFPANSYCVWDDLIIWGYHGEGWAGGQTGIFEIIRDDGLFVCRFGVPSGNFQDTTVTSCAGFSGNASSPVVFTNPHTNDLNLVVNDEGNHGGTHKWKATVAIIELAAVGALGGAPLNAT